MRIHRLIFGLRTNPSSPSSPSFPSSARPSSPSRAERAFAVLGLMMAFVSTPLSARADGERVEERAPSTPSPAEPAESKGAPAVTESTPSTDKASVVDALSADRSAKAAEAPTVPSFEDGKSSALAVSPYLAPAPKAEALADDESLVVAPRVYVELGAMTNVSGTKAASVATTLRSVLRDRMGRLSGVSVVDHVARPAVGAALERPSPTVALDGVVRRVSEAWADGRVTVSVRVDFAVRRMPDSTLRGTLTGGAVAVGKAGASPAALAGLRNEAISGAVASALRNVDGDLLVRFAK